MNSRVPGGPSPAPTSKARKQWWSTFSPKEQRPCFAVERQRTESGGRGSCCEQQFRPGIYPLIGPDMLFLYNQHSILIFFAYQLQQLQPHFTSGYCKHSKSIQSLRSLFSTTQLQPAQLSLVRCTSRTGAARR